MTLIEAFDRCLRQWIMHVQENNQDDLESLVESGDCLKAEMCLECQEVYDREASSQGESPVNNTQQLKAKIRSVLKSYDDEVVKSGKRCYGELLDKIRELSAVS